LCLPALSDSNMQKPALPDGGAGFLVPVAGVEPARPCGHGILSPGRLPIPPHRRMAALYRGNVPLARKNIPLPVFHF
jgi:hypothetical protein